jgi:hypothetical protein
LEERMKKKGEEEEEMVDEPYLHMLTGFAIINKKIKIDILTSIKLGSKLHM